MTSRAMPYKFLVDPEICIGCTACEIACKQTYNLPVGIRRRRVVSMEFGTYPHVKKIFFSMACFHCTDAPCIKACPVKALYQREDGIVLVDRKKCIGCGYCLYACPFGAPQFPESGIFGSKGKMDKCTFCVERIDEGLKPACANTCLTGALLAGKADEITKMKRERAAARIFGMEEG